MFDLCSEELQNKLIPVRSKFKEEEDKAAEKTLKVRNVSSWKSNGSAEPLGAFVRMITLNAKALNFVPRDKDGAENAGYNRVSRGDSLSSFENGAHKLEHRCVFQWLLGRWGKQRICFSNLLVGVLFCEPVFVWSLLASFRPLARKTQNKVLLTCIDQTIDNGLVTQLTQKKNSSCRKLSDSMATTKMWPFCIFRANRLGKETRSLQSPRRRTNLSSK